MTLPTTTQIEIFRDHPLPPKSFCEKHFGCCKKKKHKRGPTAIELEEEQREQSRIVNDFATKKLKSYDNSN